MPEAGAPPLKGAVTARKDAIVRGWLARTLGTYPEHTARVLGREGDPFRNPVGHAFRETLPPLFDALLAGADPEAVRPLLDRLVRIRAVQEFTADQAVAFIFLLKQAIRDALPPSGGEDELDGRIDELARLASDVFARCRDQMREIKANEAARRTYVLDRMEARRR